MTPTHVVVEGTLNPDGTLDLDTRLSLPPGRVQLIVQSLPEVPKDDPFLQRMEQVWAGQKARGQIPRTKEQIDAQISATRNEAEEEMQAVERLHRQCRSARDESVSERNEPS